MTPMLPCGDVSPSPLLLQYFIGVTVLAMVPELPEIVNGIQFALQNNISLRYTPPPFPQELRRTGSTFAFLKGWYYATRCQWDEPLRAV